MSSSLYRCHANGGICAGHRLICIRKRGSVSFSGRIISGRFRIVYAVRSKRKLPTDFRVIYPLPCPIHRPRSPDSRGPLYRPLCKAGREGMRKTRRNNKQKNVDFLTFSLSLSVCIYFSFLCFVLNVAPNYKHRRWHRKTTWK